jgi:hypothetical protein
MARIPVIVRKPLDGISIKPLLLGQARQWPDRMLFSLARGRVSVRNQKYRLDAEGRLFDIAADPGQERDVAARQPVVATRLRQAAKRWAGGPAEPGTGSPSLPGGSREDHVAPSP